MGSNKRGVENVEPHPPFLPESTSGHDGCSFRSAVDDFLAVAVIALCGQDESDGFDDATTWHRLSPLNGCLAYAAPAFLIHQRRPPGAILRVWRCS